MLILNLSKSKKKGGVEERRIQKFSPRDCSSFVCMEECLDQEQEVEELKLRSEKILDVGQGLRSDPKNHGLGRRFDNFALNTDFNGEEFEFDLEDVKKAMPENWQASIRRRICSNPDEIHKK